MIEIMEYAISLAQRSANIEEKSVSLGTRGQITKQISLPYATEPDIICK